MKKIHALHDASGKILAAALLDGSDQDAFVPRPVARMRGHQTIELELRSEHLHSGLDVILDQYRIDPKAKELVLIKQRPTRVRKARNARGRWRSTPSHSRSTRAVTDTAIR